MNTYIKPQKFILLLFCFVYLQVNAQYARSFHTTDYAADLRSNYLFNYNDTVCMLSAKECNDSTFKLQFIQLNTVGETVDYHTIEANSLYGYHMISGISINADTMVVALQSKVATLHKLIFLKIDLSNYTLLESYVNPMNFKFGYSKCLQKGDSMLVYMSNAVSGIYRFSYSLSTISSFSQELVSSITNMTGSDPAHKAFELIINGQDEYVISKATLYRRSSLGTYSSVSIPFILLGRFSFVKNNANEFVLFSSNNYLKYDSNLNFLSSGTINTILDSDSFFQEVVYDGINYHYFISGFYSLQKLVIDQNFQTSSSETLKGQTQIFGVFSSSIFNYLYGNKIEICPSLLVDTHEFITEPHSDFIVKVSNRPLPEFYEYAQELSTGNQVATLGHLNNLMLVTPISKGMAQEHNEQLKSLIFSAKNIQMANDTNSIFSYATFSKDSLLPGPFTPSSLNSHLNTDNYNRGFYVDKYLIDNHLAQITSGNSSYEMPFGIREWPAHGNPLLGQAVNLAPFFDANSNGIYEPEEGDYPSIYGDKCILYIYHHPEIFEKSNSSEILQYNYVFDCDTSEVMKNTLFMTLKNINRSDKQLENYKIGTYIDFDLGLPMDDLIATNVNLGMIYGYNGDDFDENDAGTIGFQDTLAASGMIILQGPKQKNDDIDNLFGPFSNQSVNGIGFNDGNVDNEFWGLTSSNEFTNLLFDTLNPPFNQMANLFQGLQVDGNPILLGSIPIKHAFFGDTDPYFYSSSGIMHTNDNFNTGFPGDKRIIGFSGGNVKFEEEDTVTYTTAYITAIDSLNLGSNLSSIQKLFSYGAQLKNMFVSNDAGCEMSFRFYQSPFSVGLNEMNQEQSLSIYPNPTNGSLTIDGLENSASLSVLNLNGIELLSQQITNGEQVDLSFLPKSIYILKIETSKGLITKRIVKN